MKYILSILFASVFIAGVHAQTTFSKVYDFDGDNEAALNVIVLDSGYVMFGNGTGINNGGWRVIDIVETDLLGNVISKIQYGQRGKAYYSGTPGAVKLDAFGSYYVAASIYDSISNNIDAVIIKFNSAYDTLWTYRFGGTGGEVLRSGTFTQEGNFATTGTTESFGLGVSDYLLLIVDTNGNEIYWNTYGGIGNDGATFVSSTEENGFLLGGSGNSYGNGSQSPLLFKLDSGGNVIWNKIYGTLNNDCGANGYILQNGDYFLAGCLDTIDNLDLKSFTSRLDSSGNVKWRRIFRDAERQDIWTVLEKSDNEIILVGTKNSTTSVIDVGFILAIDSLGNTLWEREYFYEAFSDSANFLRNVGWFRGADFTADGGFIVCGMGRGITVSPLTTQDFWLLKLDSMGCLTPGCDTLTSIATSVFEDDQVLVYPNPTKNYLNIELNNYYQGTTFQLYNLLGELVLTKQLTANQTSIPLNLPEGVYIYKVRSNAQTLKTGKLVVTK